jgi:TatD DNase family protein
MLLDIHTHRNAAVPGECIFNVEPAWFEPVEGCYYSVGIHPWKVLEAGPEDWTTLEKAVCHPSVLAIGEAGLDRLGPADILLQKEVFVRQILLSESVGKPLVIHCVKAFNELIELKKKYRPQMPWVVHGFRNNLHIACRLMQENIYFSLGERYQPDVLRHVPLECLLAETDESTQDIRMVIGRMAVGSMTGASSFFGDRLTSSGSMPASTASRMAWPSRPASAMPISGNAPSDLARRLPVVGLV